MRQSREKCCGKLGTCCLCMDTQNKPFSVSRLMLILNSGLGQLFGKRSPYISTYTSWSSFDLASTSLDLCLFFYVPPLLPVPDNQGGHSLISWFHCLGTFPPEPQFCHFGCCADFRWLRVDERCSSDLRVFPSLLRSEGRIAHLRAR